MPEEEIEPEILEHLWALLRISGGPGTELEVADYLRKTLVAWGVPEACITSDRAQDQSEYGGNTGNLIVRLEGHGRGARRMFSAHMDTVPNAVGTVPRQEGRRIVSGVPGKALGADNRAGCAVLLQIARALLARKGSHAPVTLVFFVQEEVGLVGARGLDLAKLGTPAPVFAMNFDSGNVEEIIVKVIGTQRFNIEIEGVAVHAGVRPEQGVSAALVAAHALSKLDREGWHGKIVKPAGEGSANLGILKGGEGSNVVMPQLYALAETRAHDRGFRLRIREVWEAAFLEAAREVRNAAGVSAKVRFSSGPCYEAIALAEDAPVVQAAQDAARAAGLPGRLVSNNGGMDANWIVAHGIPTVTIGVGYANVHTPQELLDLDQFARVCRFARALAKT